MKYFREICIVHALVPASVYRRLYMQLYVYP